MDATLQTTGDGLLTDIYTLKVEIAKLKERKLVLSKVTKLNIFSRIIINFIILKELYRQFFDGELDHKRRLKWMESIDEVKDKDKDRSAKEKKTKSVFKLAISSKDGGEG